MILDLHLAAIRWLEEEIAYLSRLAEGAEGHFRTRRSDPRLEPVEDVLDDLAAYRGEQEPAVVSVNSRASGWHFDARSYRGAVVAWVCRDVLEGGALEWRQGGEVRRFVPGDGDVALIDGNRFRHRIEPFRVGPSGCRLSVVLA